MIHLAIMKKSWKLTDKIISGEKTIESRWYKNRIRPWNAIKAGEAIYFKNSGEKVTVKAKVQKVLQFEGLNKETFKEIIRLYADQIGLENREYNDYYQSKNYCILIFLKDVELLEEPFNIDKTGYGLMSAWICVENISLIKKQ